MELLSKAFTSIHPKSIEKLTKGIKNKCCGAGAAILFRNADPELDQDS